MTKTVCPTAFGSGNDRIEEADADLTFQAGPDLRPFGLWQVVAGEGGTSATVGKHVLPIYVEATPEETEARLLRGLRKACPDLPKEWVWSTRWRPYEGIASCHRSGRCCSSWINSSSGSMPKRGEENTELVAALRHCDGEHVQAIVLVRDDFWMAATRFMRDLEIALEGGTLQPSIFLTSTTPERSCWPLAGLSGLPEKVR